MKNSLCKGVSSVIFMRSEWWLMHSGIFSGSRPFPWLLYHVFAPVPCYSAPAPIFRNKNGNGNGSGIFPPVPVRFHPYLRAGSKGAWSARWGRHPSVSPSPSKGSRPGSAMACTTPVERWGFCTFWASGCPEEGGQPRWGRGPIAGPGNQVGSCRLGRAEFSRSIKRQSFRRLQTKWRGSSI